MAESKQEKKRGKFEFLSSVPGLGGTFLRGPAATTLPSLYPPSVPHRLPGRSWPNWSHPGSKWSRLCRLQSSGAIRELGRGVRRSPARPCQSGTHLPTCIHPCHGGGGAWVPSVCVGVWCGWMRERVGWEWVWWCVLPPRFHALAWVVPYGQPIVPTLPTRGRILPSPPPLARHGATGGGHGTHAGGLNLAGEK